MIEVERDLLIINIRHESVERSAHLILEHYLITFMKFFRLRDLVFAHCDDVTIIVYTISVFRLDMYIYYIADLHICYRSIESADHAAYTACEFQRSVFTAGVELLAIIKSTFIVDLYYLAHVLSFKEVNGLTASAAGTSAASRCSVRTASTAACSASTVHVVRVTMLVAVTVFVIVVIAIDTGAYQFASEISCNCLISVAGNA